MTWLFCALGLLIAATLTGLVRAYALKYEVMDLPGVRSSHSLPTPRGGGLAIVVTLLGLLTVAGFVGTLSWAQIAALTLPGAMVAAISFVDDHQPVKNRHRLAVHLVASALALALLPQLPVISLGNYTITAPHLLWPMLVLALCWLLNLYNFMDGIEMLELAPEIVQGFLTMLVPLIQVRGSFESLIWWRRFCFLLLLVDRLVVAFCSSSSSSFSSSSSSSSSSALVEDRRQNTKRKLSCFAKKRTEGEKKRLRRFPKHTMMHVFR